jgi:hypothetical protein
MRGSATAAAQPRTRSLEGTLETTQGSFSPHYFLHENRNGIVRASYNPHMLYSNHGNK